MTGALWKIWGILCTSFTYHKEVSGLEPRGSEFKFSSRHERALWLLLSLMMAC